MWGRLGSRADKPSSDPQDSAGLVCAWGGGACANSLTSPHTLTDPNASCSRLHHPHAAPCTGQGPCHLSAFVHVFPGTRIWLPKSLQASHFTHDRSPPLAYPCGVGSPRHSQVQCEASDPLKSPAQCLPVWYLGRLPSATRPAPGRQCVLCFAQHQVGKMNDHRMGCYC